MDVNDERDHRTDCRASAAFNQRDIDRALSVMHSDHQVVRDRADIDGGIVRSIP
jgi:hypothetical protein